MSLAEKIRNLLAVAIGLPTPRPSCECRACGRLLTNPKSVAAGIGSCCAKRKPRDDKTIDLFEAGTPGAEQL